MRINKYFKEEEFACNDANKTPAPYIDKELVAILTDLREFFGVPVHITSSYRTPVYNKAVGGVDKSHHLYNDDGAASDIQVKGTRPQEVYDYLDAKYPNTFGIGLYDNFVHVDSRKIRGRW